MILKRTDSENVDFRMLVTELDEYLADIDGEEHAYFVQFNGFDTLTNVVVAYYNEDPVGCGAFKPYAEKIIEIKRMFVQPEYRGKRIGSLVLAELESWACELGYAQCILETGHRQRSAVRLYQNSGYEVIPNYEQYSGVDSSVCMSKKITLGQDATI